MTAPRAVALSLRLALRELRGGLRGFYVFLACLALGVAAIAGVGSVSRALTDGLASEGQTILGGDMDFRLTHRQASTAERNFLDGKGVVSEVATLRAMARRPDLTDQALVEIKAVDSAYPLYGAMALDGAGSLDGALAFRDGEHGAVAEPTLLARLGLSLGDALSVGDETFRIRATVAREPDRLSGGMAFGPRLMISTQALQETGLLRPGSLVRWHYRLRLPEGNRGMSSLEAVADAADSALPQAGWRIRDRAHAAPNMQTAIDRLTQLLSLVGLTALVVGGVGVANAVRGHLDTKRETIAIFKCVGAPASSVFLTYFFEVLIIAAAGVGLGIAAGAALPLIALPLLGDILPLGAATGFYATTLLLAAAYGFLIAIAFALWPLGIAREVPAAALFRDSVSFRAARPRWRYIAGLVTAFALLAALAVISASEPRIAWLYLTVVAGAILLLRLVALGLMAAARAAPRARSATLRLAIGNIHRPGALTPSVVLSLGLGLTLLVALALIDRNLTRELTASIPEQAPSFFFLDIERSEADAFDTFLGEQAPTGATEQVPMLRGRIVSLDGTAADDIEPPPDARWVLNGDRGITYSDTVPDGSRLVAGDWWEKGYGGPPLVSFEAELARALNLRIGSTVTVNVLGRDITATIANLRKLDWASLSINFVMVFSLNTFAGAPHMVLSTLTLPDGADVADEQALMAAAARAYPQVTTVRVKEALETAAGLLRQILWAIRGASSITIVASLLVLAGALAAGHRSRMREAAILKILGATRARLARAFAAEFLLLAAATALFATIAGALAAWIVLVFVMQTGFTFALAVALTTAMGAGILLVGLGLAANWRLLGQKPAPVLRAQ